MPCRSYRALCLTSKLNSSHCSTQEVVNFDSITKLDNWKTNMLLKIRNQIKDEPGLT